MQQPRIVLNQVCYSAPSSECHLDHADLIFSNKKYGIVGRNGIGKTTLFKLIVRELQPNSGTVYADNNIFYMPQNIVLDQGKKVSDLLGFKEKIDALYRIKNGSIDEKDYLILNDDWQIEEHLRHLLRILHLEDLDLNSSIKILSSGTITKLFLLGGFSSNANFLLLDEPTNHLDNLGREWLYSAIDHWDRSLIVISHDRELLNLLDEIIDIKTTGISIYSGNYNFYVEQKRMEDSAIHRELQDAEKSLQKAHKTIQNSREKLEQKQSYGKKQKSSGSIDKIGANAKKSASDKSKTGLKIKEERLTSTAESRLQIAKEKIELVDKIGISLPNTSLPNGKMVIDIENISFHYPGVEANLLENFSLKLVGPERVAISGPNGSGKTTLVKLILNEISPSQGKINFGVHLISYLDQNMNQLISHQTLLENFMRLNPDANENDAYRSLAQFLFRNVTALKKVETMSSGERLRALLSCILLAKNPPQLLILDEPTNYLDISSVECIESILNQYQGAMIVISHDKKFLKNIRIKRFIESPFRNI